MKKCQLRAMVIAFCLLSMISMVGGTKEKDEFFFDYAFELSKNRTCHVTLVETIVFNEHYIGNPDFQVEFQADQMGGAEEDSGGFYLGSGSSSGPGSGGQMTESGYGMNSLVNFLHYLEFKEYNPHNFKAIDTKTGERLQVTERSSGEYIDFIIDIKEYRGEPEKGDTYTLIIEYDTDNRIESLNIGRSAFSFYREGARGSGRCEYNVTIELPPHYEYEQSKLGDLSQISSSGTSQILRYQGEYSGQGKFELRIEYHYPVTAFVERGKTVFDKGNYSEAQELFEKARTRYETLGKQSKVAAMESLIAKCRETEAANTLLENAKGSFHKREFATAKQQFEKLISEYGTILENNEKRECNSMIETCNQYLQAQELEKQVKTDIEAEMWEAAISNLEKAKNIYANLGENDKVSWIEQRIEEVNQNKREELLESQLNPFIIGSIVIVGGLAAAFFGYNTLRKKPENTIDVGSLLESPDVPEEVKEFLEEKVGWRKVQKKSSQSSNTKVLEKLKKGKKTLENMLQNDLISEKEYNIAMEDIDKKINNLSREN